MSEKKYSNSIIFSNDKKNSKSPDFRGEIEIEGKKYPTSVWLKIAKNNKKYLSVSIENTNMENNSRSETIKRIEKLSTPNIKDSKQISQINQSFEPKKKSYISSKSQTPSSSKRKKIENLSTRYGVSTNSETNKKNLRNFGTAAKKPPKTYARFIDEPLGSREDFIKDRKRRN